MVLLNCIKNNIRYAVVLLSCIRTILWHVVILSNCIKIFLWHVAISEPYKDRIKVYTVFRRFKSDVWAMKIFYTVPQWVGEQIGVRGRAGVSG